MKNCQKLTRESPVLPNYATPRQFHRRGERVLNLIYGKFPLPWPLSNRDVAFVQLFQWASTDVPIEERTLVACTYFSKAVPARPGFVRMRARYSGCVVRPLGPAASRIT